MALLWLVFPSKDTLIIVKGALAPTSTATKPLIRKSHEVTLRPILVLGGYWGWIRSSKHGRVAAT